MAMVTASGGNGGSGPVGGPKATDAAAPVARLGGLPGSRTKVVLCRNRGALPEHGCTPGAVDPAVTQATIGTTICTSGYTATVRPRSAESNRLKAQVALAYGITDSLGNYEGDHLIPLELGGAARDVANFWDQPKRLTLADGTLVLASQKDALENALKARVCAGALSLIDAQRQIAADWYGTWKAARPEPPVVVYASCAAAKAGGGAPVHRGDPGYSPALDRDGDGVACE